MKVKIEIECYHSEYEMDFYEDGKRDVIVMDININKYFMEREDFHKKLQNIGAKIAFETLKFRGMSTYNTWSKTKIIEKNIT